MQINPSTSEEWRVIPGYERYHASSLGRIQGPRRILKPWLDGGGYPTFAPGFRNHLHVHTAVALAFHGPRPASYEVNHKDSQKTNNAADNLEWCSHGKNISHSYNENNRARTAPVQPTPEQRPRGTQYRNAKFVDDDIRAIRASDEGHKAAARRYGVSDTLIRLIRNRKAWAHVQ